MGTRQKDGRNAETGNEEAEGWKGITPGYTAPGQTQTQPEAGGLEKARAADGFSLTALICGLASIPLLALCGLGMYTAILAVVLGLVSLSRGREEAPAGSRAMAAAGVAFGFAALGLLALCLLLPSFASLLPGL